MDDIKVYMKTNKDDSDRVFNDGSDEDSNVLTQDEKRMWIILQLLQFHHCQGRNIQLIETCTCKLNH